MITKKMYDILTELKNNPDLSISRNEIDNSPSKRWLLYHTGMLKNIGSHQHRRYNISKVGLDFISKHKRSECISTMKEFQQTTGVRR